MILRMAILGKAYVKWSVLWSSSAKRHWAIPIRPGVNFEDIFYFVNDEENT
jgi:hypothetical protein